ncbi:MAG: hypothetical protein QF442_01645, partial [Candidatus Peribacteraceae bacterium]|nr:hypothetical protein [Candidatus Peribacteraceae bacterium]
PYLDITLATSIDDDQGRALFDQAIQEEGSVRLVAGERSGWARFGVETVADLQSIEEDGKAISMRARIIAISKLAQQSFLSVLREEVYAGQPVSAGSMILLPHDARMTSEEILEASKQNKILLPKGVTISDDGRVLIPLGPVCYKTNHRRRITRDEVRDVLLEGKHALNGIQSPEPGYPDSRQDFIVSGMALSVGAKMGVLLQDTVAIGDDAQEKPSPWEHLSAVRLDPYRTTGFADLTADGPDYDCVRQLELRRKSDLTPGEEPLSNIHVQMELYHTGAERVSITNRVNREGLSFFDSKLITNPHLLGSVMDLLAVSSDYKDVGMLIGPGRAVAVPYIQQKDQQDAELRKTALPTFLADSPPAGDPDADILLRGSALPPGVRTLAEEVLVDIGGSQSASKMYASRQFRLDMHELYSSGVGIFVSNGLQQKNGDRDMQESSRQFFTGTEHHEFRQLADRGAHICRYTEEPHTEEPHLSIFQSGFWVDPNRLEEFKKVTTYIAMYGTHKDEFMAPLYECGHLGNFMERMAKLFGEEAGVTHGKGVGFMGAVSQFAKENRIWQSAVGINAGPKGQGSSHGQEATVVFSAEDRLDRQKMMDDMSVFKMFGIGGGGTLEEAAITICSQKLNNQVPTPLIFVDFMKEYRGDQGHLWEDLRKLVGRFAAGQSLTMPDGESVKLENDGAGTVADKGEKLLSLIDSWVPNNIHLVDRFGDDAKTVQEEDNPSAATIIEKFHHNPVDYWKSIGVLSNNWQDKELEPSDQVLIDKLAMSYQSMQETFVERGIQFPKWLEQHDPVKILAT